MKKLIYILSITLMAFCASAQKKNVTDSKQDTSLAKYDKLKPELVTLQPTKQVFFVIGDLGQFKLIYSSISAPDDVTTNQKKALLDWLIKNVQALPTDSTGKKK